MQQVQYFYLTFTFSLPHANVLVLLEKESASLIFSHIRTAADKLPTRKVRANHKIADLSR